MSKRTAVLVALGLFALSAAIYLVQIAVFNDPRDTLFYLLQDWAFLPVQIAVVTIAVGMVVSEMQRRERIEKTNMLTSSFFSDGGTELLRKIISCSTKPSEVRSLIAVDASWEKSDYVAAIQSARAANLSVRCSIEDLRDIQQILAENRMSMLVIASNPVLLEHEEFTDMLWSVFHLTDEFTYRGDLDKIPSSHLEHLDDDAERALRGLILNWLCNMRHLQEEYPYLFTVAALEAQPEAGAPDAS